MVYFLLTTPPTDQSQSMPTLWINPKCPVLQIPTPVTEKWRKEVWFCEACCAAASIAHSPTPLLGCAPLHVCTASPRYQFECVWHVGCALRL